MPPKELSLTQRDRIMRLTEITKRKAPTKLKVLAHILSELNDSVLACSKNHVSRSLMIGLSAALRGIKKSESQLGLFSDDFDALAESMAGSLARLAQLKDEKASKWLLKQYIVLTAIVTAGALYLAARSKAAPDTLKLELMTNLLFYTDYPKEIFTQMVETLEATKIGQELVANSLELFSLLVATMVFSKGSLAMDERLLETLLPRLGGCIDNIDRSLTEVKTAEDTALSLFRAYLQQIKIAIELQDIDPLVKTISEIVESYGLSHAHLNADLEAIKKLFRNYEEAILGLSTQRSMTIDVIG